jgi:transcriptional regulator with XRE-family HTH domain
MTEEQKQQTRERIGQRVKALRLLADLSQDELAQRAGLQRTHIGRIEGGKYAVNIETLQAIAEALGMTVDIIDPALQDLAPLKRLTEPMKDSLGEALNKKVTEVFTPNDTDEPDPKADIKAKRIVDCDLSVRTMNICIANDINTIGDLCKLRRTDWLKFRNSGKKTLIELDDLLHDNGLDWAE